MPVGFYLNSYYLRKQLLVSAACQTPTADVSSCLGPHNDLMRYCFSISTSACSDAVLGANKNV